MSHTVTVIFTDDNGNGSTCYSHCVTEDISNIDSVEPKSFINGIQNDEDVKDLLEAGLRDFSADDEVDMAILCNELGISVVCMIPDHVAVQFP